jgi:hypothetical protein
MDTFHVKRITLNDLSHTYISIEDAKHMSTPLEHLQQLSKVQLPKS